MSKNASRLLKAAQHLPALTLVIAFCVLLPACSTQRQVNDLANGLSRSSPEGVLAALLQLQTPARDQAQYLLNLGTLELLTGDFAASIDSLQQAKVLINSLQALSVTENLAAGTINETLRAYTGTPAERVLLQQVLASCYLMQGDLDSARVEALQADVLMHQLAGSDPLRGQLASARFLSGLIFELGGEWDDAMISYRKAEQIMTRRGQALPGALMDSLLILSQRQHLDGEYRDYVSRFGYSAPTRRSDEGELIIFFWDGVVSSKAQRFISVYVPELQQTISLALPYYPPSFYRPRHLSVQLADQHYHTAVVEDIEALARSALEDRRPAIYAMALTRMISKHQAVRAAQKDSPFAGMVANLAALFSEVADTRSWNMLPSSIQIARIALPPGQYTLRFPGGSAAAPASVRVNAGEKVVVLAPQVSQSVYSYSYQP